MLRRLLLVFETKENSAACLKLPLLCRVDLLLKAIEQRLPTQIRCALESGGKLKRVPRHVYVHILCMMGRRRH